MMPPSSPGVDPRERVTTRSSSGSVSPRCATAHDLDAVGGGPSRRRAPGSGRCRRSARCAAIAAPGRDSATRRGRRRTLEPGAPTAGMRRAPAARPRAIGRRARGWLAVAAGPEEQPVGALERADGARGEAAALRARRGSDRAAGRGRRWRCRTAARPARPWRPRRRAPTRRRARTGARRRGRRR